MVQPCPRWTKVDAERGCGASAGCGPARSRSCARGRGPEYEKALVVLVRAFGSGAPGGEGRLPSFGARPAALPLHSPGPCCRRTGEA